MGFPANSFAPSARSTLGKLPKRTRRTGHEGKRAETLIGHLPVGVKLVNVAQSAKWFRGRGQDKCVPHAVRGPCEFLGCYEGSGRMLALDAKESADPNKLVTNEDHLPENQRRLLIDFGEAGAVAGLLALRTTDDQWFWFGWRLLSPQRPSIPWSEGLEMGWAGKAIQWGRILAAEAKGGGHD